MKIITAIQNKEINEKIKEMDEIKILNTDIQYKEGILEYLEKNKKLDIILLKEKLPGQIKLEELIKSIQKINNKIKIIILLEKNNKEEIKNTENINYIYLEKINLKNILRLLNFQNEKEKKKK